MWVGYAVYGLAYPTGWTALGAQALLVFVPRPPRAG